VSTQLLTFCGAKFALVDFGEGLCDEGAELAAAIADTGLVILSLGPRTT
jgi:hypothetical protein